MHPVSPTWHIQIQRKKNTHTVGLWKLMPGMRALHWLQFRQQLQGRTVKNAHLSAFLLSNSVCSFYFFGWSFSPQKRLVSVFPAFFAAPL